MLSLMSDANGDTDRSVRMRAFRPGRFDSSPLPDMEVFAVPLYKWSSEPRRVWRYGRLLGSREVRFLSRQQD